MDSETQLSNLNQLSQALEDSKSLSITSWPFIGFQKLFEMRIFGKATLILLQYRLLSILCIALSSNYSKYHRFMLVKLQFIQEVFASEATNKNKSNELHHQD